MSYTVAEAQEHFRNSLGVATVNLARLIRTKASEESVKFLKDYINAIREESATVGDTSASISVSLNKDSMYAVMSEHGFGGNGPGDSQPDYGKEGPYRMNELLLKGRDHVDIKFAVARQVVQQRIETLINSPRFGAATTAEARQKVSAMVDALKIGYRPDPSSPKGYVKTFESSEKSSYRLGLRKGIDTLKPHHVANPLTGMMREQGSYTAGNADNQFIIFRRLSLNSKAWVHPGIKGSHLFQRLPQDYAAEMQQALKPAVVSAVALSAVIGVTRNPGATVKNVEVT